MATALIDDSGKRVGAAAIAAAAIATAPKATEEDIPGPTAAAVAAAVAIAEEVSRGQSEEISPSELATQVLSDNGQIPPNVLVQNLGDQRPLLLKPVYPAMSQRPSGLPAALHFRRLACIWRRGNNAFSPVSASPCCWLCVRGRGV